MITATGTHAEPAILTSTNRPARGSRLAWWIAGGALGLLAGGVVLASVGNWLSGWWGKDGAQTSFHVVEPSTLSITLSEDGELKPKDSNEIKNEVEGQSTILTIVAESTRVKKGDLLVELASNELVERMETEKIEFRRVEADAQAAAEDFEITKNQNLSDVKKTELDLTIAELELRKYMEGDYPKELKSLEIDIEKTELDIRRKEDELGKQEKLLAKGFVTESKLEELRFDLRNTRSQLEKSNLSLSILKTYDFEKNRRQKGSDLERAQEELGRVKKRADSKLKQAEVKLEQAQATLAVRRTRQQRVAEQLEKCKIFAPCDGVVQYPSNQWGWDEGRVGQGKKVQEGQNLIILPDTSKMVVHTRIHESDRHRVKEGMRCLVKVAAVPGKTFTGTLSKVARFADSANRWINPDLKEHATEIALDETDAPLAPGDSAEVRILIEDVPNALSVPVQSVHVRGKKSFVFVQKVTGAAPIEVTLGRSTTTMIEVAGGLSAGDRVLLKSDERLDAMLPAINAPGARDDSFKTEATRVAVTDKPAEARVEVKADAKAEVKVESQPVVEPAVPASDAQPAGEAAPASQPAADEARPT